MERKETVSSVQREFVICRRLTHCMQFSQCAHGRTARTQSWNSESDVPISFFSRECVGATAEIEMYSYLCR